MKFQRIFSICASITVTSCTTTNWPAAIGVEQPAISQSARKTTWPDIPVEPPLPNVAPDRSRWSGKWEGWACQSYACDTKLLVVSVSNEGAKVVPLWAMNRSESPHPIRDAVFVGDELHIVSDEPKFYYRIRKNGQMEMMRMSNDVMGYGVMTKVR